MPYFFAFVVFFERVGLTAFFGFGGVASIRRTVASKRTFGWGLILGGDLGMDETIKKLEAQIRKFGDSWLDEMSDQHAEKIGHVAMSWARMQEHLGQLFVYLVSPDHFMRGWAAWHAITSDSQQRNCLAAVVRQVYPDKKDPIRVEIEWILGRIQAHLDNRNGAIHVAFQLGVGDDDLRLVPIDQTGNPRATKLMGRNLHADFEFTSAWIIRLGLHAKALAPYLRPHRPVAGQLPQRPPAPVPPPTKGKNTQDEPE